MFLTLIENQYKDNLNEAQSYIYIFCKVFKLAGEGKT